MVNIYGIKSYEVGTRSPVSEEHCVSIVAFQFRLLNELTEHPINEDMEVQMSVFC